MKPLPEQVLVRPQFYPLDDERDMVTGHTISAGNYLFVESGATHIYYERAEQVRLWLATNGYHYEKPLRHTYLSTESFHGYWSRND